MIEYPKIHGLFKRYTDGQQKGKFIIGDWSLPEFEYLKDNIWIGTEKLDGTNVRVLIYRNPLNLGRLKIEFKGRTDKASLPINLVDKLENLFKPEIVFNVFEVSVDKPNVCIYGEGVGYKIQKDGLNYVGNRRDNNFVIFDIKIGKFWLKRDIVIDIAQRLGIDYAPIVFKGTLNQAIDFVKSKPKSTFGNKDFLMEGIVLTPEVDLADRHGNRIITKIKLKDF